MAPVFAAAIGPACLDFSPLPYAGPDAGSTDATTANVGDGAPVEDGATGSLIAACRECLTSGACASKGAACRANSQCAAVTECITEMSCWGMINIEDTASLPACATLCSMQTGLTSLDNPATLLAVPLFQCSTAPTGCQSVCAPAADQ
jgi:hypothetical protein